MGDGMTFMEVLDEVVEAASRTGEYTPVQVWAFIAQRVASRLAEAVEAEA